MHNMKKTACLVILSLAALVICSCKDTVNGSIIPDAALRECREGDIVLREGTAIESHVVSVADSHSHFTHCGVIARLDGELVVVHAVPDEPDFDGDVDRVKAEPIDRFFSTKRAKHGCLLRCLTDSITAKRSASKALELFRRHTLFDHEYDDADTMRMYCSELIVFSYAQAGFKFNGLHRRDYSFVKMKLRRVLLPSEFSSSSQTKLIASF